jgi:hypothetical protein
VWHPTLWNMIRPKQSLAYFVIAISLGLLRGALSSSGVPPAFTRLFSSTRNLGENQWEEHYVRGRLMWSGPAPVRSSGLRSVARWLYKSGKEWISFRLCLTFHFSLWTIERDSTELHWTAQDINISHYVKQQLRALLKATRNPLRWQPANMKLCKRGNLLESGGAESVY